MSDRKGRAPRPVENLCGLLDQICSLAACGDPAAQEQRVSVRALFSTIGRRSYGPLLLAVGLFAISPLTAVPGMTWATAALTLLIAGQLTLGLPRPWMPRALLETEIPAGALVRGVEFVRPWAQKVDAILKPRLSLIAKPPFVMLIGLLCSAAALVTFPLGFIPLAPLAPGLAVVLFGLGLVARDGLVLIFGIAACAATGWILFDLFAR